MNILYLILYYFMYLKQNSDVNNNNFKFLKGY